MTLSRELARLERWLISLPYVVPAGFLRAVTEARKLAVREEERAKENSNAH